MVIKVYVKSYYFFRTYLNPNLDSSRRSRVEATAVSYNVLKLQRKTCSTRNFLSSSLKVLSRRRRRNKLRRCCCSQSFHSFHSMTAVKYWELFCQHIGEAWNWKKVLRITKAIKELRFVSKIGAFLDSDTGAVLFQ